MTEKRTVVEGVGINYEGYFYANDLYKLINNFVGERGYDRFDKLNEVILKEDGRQISLDLRPTKSISDYQKAYIQVKVTMKGVTDAEVELDGKKLKLNKGRVNLTISAYLFSDYQSDWMSNPWRVFLKTLVDKFVYRQHTADADKALRDDVNRLRNEINAFLNLNKYIQL